MPCGAELQPLEALPPQLRAKQGRSGRAREEGEGQPVQSCPYASRGAKSPAYLVGVVMVHGVWVKGINPPVLTGCRGGDCPCMLLSLLRGIRRTVCSCLFGEKQ